MAWYTIILTIAWVIFILQFLLLLLSNDLDYNERMNLGLRDLFSFKGVLHFTIGFALVLTLYEAITLFTCALGFFVGIGFLISFFGLYKFIKILKQEISNKKDQTL